MEIQPPLLQDEYRIRFASSESYRNNVWKILCEAYFSKLISPAAHVLDLGCGWGEFINNIKAARKYAMDLNPDTGCRLSDETRFMHQDCAQEWPLQSESLDVVFTSNFLEHLPDKGCVQTAVSEAYRCLKPGGIIICLGPNIKYVRAAYWDFWDHLIPITETSLAELLRLHEFTVQLQIARFLPYSMSGGRRPPLLMLKLYLKMPLLWRLFGKQFLVVGKKNNTCGAPPLPLRQ